MTPVESAPAAPPENARSRGTLVIEDRALRHLTEGAVRTSLPTATDVKVAGGPSESGGVTFDISLRLRALDRPLPVVLSELRARVGHEVARVSGQQVRRLDLRVDSLSGDTPGPAPRVV